MKTMNLKNFRPNIIEGLFVLFVFIYIFLLLIHFYELIFKYEQIKNNLYGVYDTNTGIIIINIVSFIGGVIFVTTFILNHLYSSVSKYLLTLYLISAIIFGLFMDWIELYQASTFEYPDKYHNSVSFIPTIPCIWICCSTLVIFNIIKIENKNISIITKLFVSIVIAFISYYLWNYLIDILGLHFCE